MEDIEDYSQIVNDEIPQDATNYAKIHLREIIECVEQYKEAFNLNEKELNDAILGDSYIIYDLDTKKQDEIYYYPVYNDQKSKVLFVVSVMGTTEGWCYSVDGDLVDLLNNINYHGDFILYESDDNIIADNDEKEYALKGEMNEKCDKMANMEIDNKIEKISDRIDSMEKVDINEEFTQTKEQYTPAYNYNKNNKIILDLYNKKGQYGKPICWAASVATIVNYRKGTNYSASQICKKMGLKEVGQDIYTKKSALRKFGVKYNIIRNSVMSWEKLYTNIKGKYPVAITSNNKKLGAHAVTAYGVNGTQSLKREVVLWNSGLKNGMGGITIMQYKGSASVYSYDGATFVWTASLSYK